MLCKCLNNGLRFLWITLIVLGIDRYTKILAQKHLIFHTPSPVMPFFNFTLSYNTGSAFGFLDSATGYQGYLFGSIAIIVSLIILVALKRMNLNQKWLAIALSLILGGALGNLWDRFLYGHVIDFIQWYVGNYSWPIFNVADSAVCVGAAMIILDAFRNRKHPGR